MTLLLKLVVKVHLGLGWGHLIAWRHLSLLVPRESRLLVVIVRFRVIVRLLLLVLPSLRQKPAKRVRMRS